VDGITGLVERDGGDYRNLVLGSSTWLAARSLPAEVDVIYLDLSPKQIGLLPLTHGPQNLVV
jgi:hypothetical protein